MEPMIPMATIQSRTLMMLIVWTPGFVMRFRSEMTSSLVTRGEVVGDPGRMAAYDDGHREILPVEGELLRVSDVEEHCRCAEVVAELVTDAHDPEVLATQWETIADRESERLVDDGLPGPANRPSAVDRWFAEPAGPVADDIDILVGIDPGDAA